MSDKLLIEEALRRRKIFSELGSWLKKIKEKVKEIDPDAEVYLFGSVAENRHTYSSDIDILVITDKGVEEILPKLWEAGIEDPFEIHVRARKYLQDYAKRSKLVKI